MANEFDEGNIPGFVHLSQGQEAIAAGAMAAINEDDYIITTPSRTRRTAGEGWVNRMR